MFEPPYDCDLCRMELADRMLDCADGDISVSVASFIASFILLTKTFDTDIIFRLDPDCYHVR